MCQIKRRKNAQQGYQHTKTILPEPHLESPNKPKNLSTPDNISIHPSSLNNSHLAGINPIPHLNNPVPNLGNPLAGPKRLPPPRIKRQNQLPLPSTLKIHLHLRRDILRLVNRDPPPQERIQAMEIVDFHRTTHNQHTRSMLGVIGDDARHGLCLLGGGDGHGGDHSSWDEAAGGDGLEESHPGGLGPENDTDAVPGDDAAGDDRADIEDAGAGEQNGQGGEDLAGGGAGGKIADCQGVLDALAGGDLKVCGHLMKAWVSKVVCEYI
ncbi:hypothetical protein V8F33_005985 [Rhypophila sp. PSN 637]